MATGDAGVGKRPNKACLEIGRVLRSMCEGMGRVSSRSEPGFHVGVADGAAVGGGNAAESCGAALTCRRRRGACGEGTVGDSEKWQR